MKSKRALKKAIKEFKDTVIWDNKDRVIGEVCNLLNEYWNDTQDWSLDEYTYKFTSADLMEDYIKDRMNKYWLSQVARDIKAIDSDDDYYWIDDTYWEVFVIDPEDVEDWIDDILESL